MITTIRIQNYLISLQVTPSCYLFIVIPPSYSNPWHHWCVLHHCNFAILRMLYKWNYTLCILLILAFFGQYNGLAMHVSCVYVDSLFLFIADSVPWCRCTTMYSFTHWRTSDWFLVLGCHIELKWKSMHKFLCKLKFSFL